MVLVGRKAAPQRMWLHLLFHVIPVIEASHPPVFSHKDTQLLLTRLQVSHFAKLIVVFCSCCAHCFIHILLVAVLFHFSVLSLDTCMAVSPQLSGNLP